LSRRFLYCVHGNTLRIGVDDCRRAVSSSDAVVDEGVRVPTLVSTLEQDVAVEAFRAGSHLVLQAGAGTGKTSTLAMLGAATGRRGKYVAFNKAIALEAARTFPANVQCRTGHSLAWRAVGRRFSARLNGARMPGWKIGRALGITAGVPIGERLVSDRALSYTTLQTVKPFCQSADRQIHDRHVPRLRGIEAPQAHARLVEVVLPYAERAWADLQNPDQGVVRFEHDHYLKMWALTHG
jgi:hypothetical protein